MLQDCACLTLPFEARLRQGPTKVRADGINSNVRAHAWRNLQFCNLRSFHAAFSITGNEPVLA